ncbi:hypothetical protein NQ314_016298 [Rhamnusium bicolor]|uniref:Uncharacterized protein n=1 Tax=Rhamnusium bicolor TaxID=1586634 RepID=A0AAV8WVZ0_9CUCU|nr:hypothetical protein NQ314_016298 [Rhamnusium bicolor]
MALLNFPLNFQNSLMIFGCIVTVAVAQRPPYAGSSPKGYPLLASRFQDTSSDSAPVPDNTIANRIGDENSGTTIKLPVDARGDADLVMRLNQWPRDNRPFWLINAEHIEKQRNPEANPTKQIGSRSSFDVDPSAEVRTIRPPIRRSPFLGSLDRS